MNSVHDKNFPRKRSCQIITFMQVLSGLAKPHRVLNYQKLFVMSYCSLKRDRTGVGEGNMKNLN